MATPKQRICVVMTTGTNDALKTELAVVTAFGLRKNGHDVVRTTGLPACSVPPLRRSYGLGRCALLEPPSSYGNHKTKS